jgi:hypothetical protein
VEVGGHRKLEDRAVKDVLTFGLRELAEPGNADPVRKTP